MVSSFRALTIVGLMIISLSLVPSAEELLLAKNQQAYLPICVSETASRKTFLAAQELAHKLKLITGAQFQVKRGREPSSIFLSTLDDTPDGSPYLQGLKSSEAYFIKTSGTNVWLCARSQAGVNHAVYDLLHKIGYRRYFPSENWEIIPSLKTLRLSIELKSEPAFKERRIAFTWGLWKEEKELFDEWAKVNRVADDYRLLTSHASARIVWDFKDEFKAHPEYFALVKGKRKPRHFCYSNLKLQKIIGDSALKYLQRNPKVDTFSVEPADGNHWCECQPCQAMGSPSNRLAIVANVVGKRLEQSFPDKKVAFLAYNLNGPPPERENLNYQPTVTATTKFLRQGSTLESNLSGWKDVGAGDLGVYEYPSFYSWGRDMPGTADMSSSSNLSEAVPHYSRLGANIYIAESSYNWGSVGFAHYFLTKQLWNPTGADYAIEHADFLQRAFGPRASQDMKSFYKAIDSKETVLNSSQLVHELYTHLSRAFGKESRADVRRRLAELTAYVRYVELQIEFQRAEDSQKKRLAEILVAHLARSRKAAPVHLKTMYHSERDPFLKAALKANWAKSGPSLLSARWNTQDSLNAIRTGLRKHTQGFARAESNWGPLAPASFQSKLKRQLPQFKRGYRKRNYLVYTPPGKGIVDLTVTGGQIAHYRDRGPVKLRYGEQSKTVPPTGEKSRLNFVSKPGLQTLSLDDGGDASTVLFPPGTPVAVEFGKNFTPHFLGRHSGYFFVPPDVDEVIVYSEKSGGSIKGPDGQVLKTLQAFDYARIPARGMTGKLWRASKVAPGFRLLNVPPYLGHDPNNFLIPESYQNGTRP